MNTRTACAAVLIAAGIPAVRPAIAAPPPLAEGAWTLLLLPDTQYYSQSYPQIFEAQTRWIAENREARNIRFVLHEGDITNNNTAVQWQNARTAMDILNAAGVPYALVPGNHDLGANGGTSTRDTLMSDYFKASDYANSAIVGFFEEGRVENSFHTFEAGGRKYVVLALEFGPRDTVVAWADKVLADHRDHTGILLTHAYVYSDETRYDWAVKANSQVWNPHSYGIGGSAAGVNDGEELWRKLVSRHPHVAFTFNGHVLYDGAGHVVSFNEAGGLVHQLLANYQGGVVKPDAVNGGDGYLRLVEFQPDGKRVKVATYSPYTDRLLTDSDQAFTFSLEPADYRTVVAANLSVDTSVSANAPVITIPSGHPGMAVAAYAETLANVASPNGGDYQVTIHGVGPVYHAGALLATVRENGRTLGAGTQYTSVEVPHNAFVDGRASLAVSEAGYLYGAREANVNVATAWFPYAGGWRAAYVNGSGSLLFGNGIQPSDVKAIGAGRYTVSLAGVDSRDDGMLFAIGAANEDNTAGATVQDDGSWLVTVRDNGVDFATLEADYFTVLYMPYSARNLVGGRIAEDGTTLKGAGEFTLTRESAGVYRLRIPGQSPDSGMLLLTVGKSVTDTTGLTAADDNVLSYQADGDDFVIQSRDTPDMALEDTGFHFAFVGFANPPGVADPVSLGRQALRAAAGLLSASEAAVNGRASDRDGDGVTSLEDAVGWMREAAGL